MKKIALFLFAATLMLVGCNNNQPAEEGAAVSDISAEDAVKQIYDEVFDAYIHLPLEKLITIDFDHKFLSSAFLQLDTIVNEIDKSHPGKLGFRDYDHWIQA